MKTFLNYFIPLSLTGAALANVEPEVVIQSAAMRPGTTFMDVVYRVNDPDDATVKTRALAFVDGVRSFNNVIRPVTFVEGTEVNLGDTIASNTDHTLTWNVAADWNIDLGQISFEVLARDTRGLLEIDWITVPAVAGEPEITLSKSHSGTSDALFWQYATGDPALTLENANLRGNENSGVFAGVELVRNDGVTLGHYASPYVFKLMDLDPEEYSVVSYASSALRPGFGGWQVKNQPYSGIAPVIAWVFQSAPPAGVIHPIAISGGLQHSIVLNHDGKVFGKGAAPGSSIPSDLSNVIAIASGWRHSLALKADGTVVAWGDNGEGQSTVPAGLTNVIAIAGGKDSSLALKSDSTIVGWGEVSGNANLTNVIDIKVNGELGLALLNDGTIVGWGSGNEALPIPAGLTNIVAISVGQDSALALKSDGTIVGWGNNQDGQTTIPDGLTGVVAISMSYTASLALRNDGTVIRWGRNSGLASYAVPSGLTGVIAIDIAGYGTNMTLKAKAP